MSWEDEEELRRLNTFDLAAAQGVPMHAVNLGEPCLKCRNCSGFELHVWKKACRHCGCARTDHTSKPLPQQREVGQLEFVEEVPEDFDPTGYGYNYEDKLAKQDKFGVAPAPPPLKPRSGSTSYPERPVTPPQSQRLRAQQAFASSHDETEDDSVGYDELSIVRGGAAPNPVPRSIARPPLPPPSDAPPLLSKRSVKFDDDSLHTSSNDDGSRYDTVPPPCSRVQIDLPFYDHLSHDHHNYATSTDDDAPPLPPPPRRDVPLPLPPSQPLSLPPRGNVARRPPMPPPSSAYTTENEYADVADTPEEEQETTNTDYMPMVNPIQPLPPSLPPRINDAPIPSLPPRINEAPLPSRAPLAAPPVVPPKVADVAKRPPLPPPTEQEKSGTIAGPSLPPRVYSPETLTITPQPSLPPKPISASAISPARNADSAPPPLAPKARPSSVAMGSTSAGNTPQVPVSGRPPMTPPSQSTSPFASTTRPPLQASPVVGSSSSAINSPSMGNVSSGHMVSSLPSRPSNPQLTTRDSLGRLPSMDLRAAAPPLASSSAVMASSSRPLTGDVLDDAEASARAMIHVDLPRQTAEAMLLSQAAMVPVDQQNGMYLIRSKEGAVVITMFYMGRVFNYQFSCKNGVYCNERGRAFGPLSQVIAHYKANKEAMASELRFPVYPKK